MDVSVSNMESPAEEFSSRLERGCTTLLEKYIYSVKPTAICHNHATLYLEEVCSVQTVCKDSIGPNSFLSSDHTDMCTVICNI